MSVSILHIVTLLYVCLQTIVPDSGLSLLSLSNGVNSCDSTILIVDGPLPVLGKLLSGGPSELAEGAVVGCLPHSDGGASLVILQRNGVDRSKPHILEYYLVIDDNSMDNITVSQHVLLAFA